MATQIAESVDAGAINANTGAITEVAGAPFSTQTGTGAIWSLVADPAGSFLFASVQPAFSKGTGLPEGPYAIVTFTIDRNTGALTPGRPLQVFRSGPMVGTANGNFLYIAAPEGWRVYSVNRNSGALTEVAGSPFAGTSNVGTLLVSPDSKYLVNAAVNQTGPDGDLEVWALDPSTGKPTPVSGSPFSTGGAHLSSAAFSPDGKYVYVTNAANTTIPDSQNPASNGSLITISFSASGQAAVVGNSVATPGSNPRSLAVDATGKFLYLGDERGQYPFALEAFAVDATTHTPSLVNGSPFLTTSTAPSIAVDLSSKWLYVSDAQDGTETLSIDASTGAPATASKANTPTGMLTVTTP